MSSGLRASADRSPRRRLLARALGRLARYRPVEAWLHQALAVYRETRPAAPAAAAGIPEITPIEPRPGATGGRSRINLLVPALSARHLFGGIETALQVFDAVRGGFDTARIVVTDEVAPEPRADAWYSGWPVLSLDDPAPPSDHVVPAGSRWARSLEVGPDDYFMATAWWTAHNGFALLDWQRRNHPQAAARKLLYLIQDYEPGFYPWSSRWVLARATYERPGQTAAVVNAQSLADYLSSQGHRLDDAWVLSPQFNPRLAAAREAREVFRKERLILVYGRPGTERNGFALIVEALRRWAAVQPDAAAWSIVSAGESFEPIDLGAGCRLESLGKVSLDDYADLLARAAVGLSLMISPHPSYPPLEMAAFGARVLTNRFGGKDLASHSSFIRSVDTPDPDSLATALRALTAAWNAAGGEPLAVRRVDIDWQGDFLERPGLPPAWGRSIRERLAGPTGASPDPTTFDPAGSDR